MKYLSVCSGIEAASVAWGSLGWSPAAFSEIDPFPCSVLRERFPDVPNLGDMTKFEEWPIEPGSIDVLVGGTPCQSFSIAGLRGGLEDGRGNLALTYCRILNRFKPRWFIWENVPGVLSSNSGRDFGSILGAMAHIGYSFAWRILDAQHFGVPQRRRRVFVVGHLGDWRRPAEVLFEPGCVRGDTPKGGTKKQDIAGTLASRTSAGGGLGTDFDLDGGLRVVGALACNTGPNGHDAGNFACNQAVDAGHLIASTGNISHCLNAGGMGRQDYETETMVVSSFRTAGDGAVYDSGSQVAALTTATDPSANIIAFSSKDHGADFGNVSPTLRAMNHTGSHANAGGQVAKSGVSSGVRRLTPLECERLQGFPDDWTLVTHRGKPAADGPRYKAIGNSMAVPVMRWIGKRIQTLEQS